MFFNSFSFAVFLPIVFGIYWSLPYKYRWGCLLLASYYFYMSWNAKYIVLVFFTTLVSYISAICLERIENSQKRKLITFVATFLCLGTLVYFKYFNFVSVVDKLFRVFFDSTASGYCRYSLTCWDFILYVSNIKLHNRCL